MSGNGDIYIATKKFTATGSKGGDKYHLCPRYAKDIVKYHSPTKI